MKSKCKHEYRSYESIGHHHSFYCIFCLRQVEMDWIDEMDNWRISEVYNPIVEKKRGNDEV